MPAATPSATTARGTDCGATPEKDGVCCGVCSWGSTLVAVAVDSDAVAVLTTVTTTRCEELDTGTDADEDTTPDEDGLPVDEEATTTV